MIACHGALTTVNHVDRLRQRFKATQQSVDDHDRCADDDVIMTSSVEAHRCTTRARSLPLDTSETMRRRLVSRGTQTSSALARYLTVAAAANVGQDEAWLRRIDAMDLSFPVSRQSELRCFLADTLALAEYGGDADGKQAAVSKPRTPQMRRRWAACDLRLDDGPTTTADVDDQPSTALDNDPEQWTDDDDDDEILSSVPVYGGSDSVVRPVIARWTPGMCSVAETRPYFRSGCRTVSRLPAPNMPMIREDEQSASSADDDDLIVSNIRTMGFPPPAEPPPLLRPLQKSPACVQKARCSHATGASDADVELVRCIRHTVKTSTIHDLQPAPPTSTSPSLLDTMHKKYCANQYARRQAPSTPDCHLLDLVTRTSSTPRPSADCGCNTVNDFITRQTVTAEPVSGNHVTSLRRGDCDPASDATVGDSVEANDANTCFSTAASSVDVTSSTLSTTGFDDDEVEEDDDEEEDNGELRDETQRNKYDDQPWKKRFCDYCHGELKVKLYFATYRCNYVHASFALNAPLTFPLQKIPKNILRSFSPFAGYTSDCIYRVRLKKTLYKNFNVFKTA